MKQKPTTDSDLLGLSLSKPARFGDLYDRHAAAVHRFLSRRVGADLAEDLTAETFIRAFRRREGYRDIHTTALPWLYGIANSLIGDHRRAERRRLATLEKLVQQAGQLPLSAEHEPEGISPELLHSLRKLPAKDRDTLLLVAWGELSYEETARALDIPIGTVRSRISRARQRLVSSTRSPELAPCQPIATRGENHA